MGAAGIVYWSNGALLIEDVTITLEGDQFACQIVPQRAYAGVIQNAVCGELQALIVARSPGLRIEIGAEIFLEHLSRFGSELESMCTSAARDENVCLPWSESATGDRTEGFLELRRIGPLDQFLVKVAYGQPSFRDTVTAPEATLDHGQRPVGESAQGWTCGVVNDESVIRASKDIRRFLGLVAREAEESG